MIWQGMTDDGCKLKLTFCSEKLIRIQLFPQDRKLEDSALNRYEFIREPAEEFQPESVRTPDGEKWQCSRYSFAVDSRNGKFILRDSGENILVDFSGGHFAENFAYASFKARKDEDWIGFGDQTRERIYHRGHQAKCWVSNVSSYLPVPCFMSTAGYGILVNSTHQVLFDMCRHDPDVFQWRDERGVVDFYLMIAPTFKELIGIYTDLTGKPKLPPEWSFGMWFICRTQANAAEVMDNADRLRREKIPCDLIGLEPGWMEKNYDSSVEKQWSKDRFDLADWQKGSEFTFIKTLNRMGFHLELWLCMDYDLSFEEERRIRKDDRVREEEFQAVFDENNEQDMHFASPVFMDKITRRDEPWFKHLENFVDWGADCFKQDGGYQVCTHPDRLYGNGMIDREMHNLYPLLYSRQMWEGFARYTNRRPVVFTVAGWAGFQSWCGTWTGDTGGRLETLGAMLNTAMLGHSWATNDMEVTQPEGIHFGYLQPWSQINSWTYFRHPWLLGDKLLALHQFYSRLRSRLVPYIYSWAYQAVQTAQPLLLPLTIEFQNDLNCRKILHEYLLGRDLLVTIYKREVYFPEGSWKDFWTGEVVAGGQFRTISWPEDRGGGLFVREGGIVSLGPVMQYRHEKPLDEMELYIFPSEQGSSFDFYEDDGVSFDYLQGKYHLTGIAQQKFVGEVVISIGDSPENSSRRWALTVALPEKPQRILNNGNMLEDSAWNFDPERAEVKISNVQPGEVKIVL